MSQEEPIRRRRSRRESAAGQFWRQNRLELIGLIVIALGVFLVLERMNLRATLAAWWRMMVGRLFSHFQQLDAGLTAFLAQISLSDFVGAVLITGAVVAVLYHIRWRLMNNPSLAAAACPKCDGPIHRIHRKPLDRLISVYVPVRRYRCHQSECNWNGLRVGRHHVSARVRGAG